MLQWYDEAKVGIFIHFGVYAVPGFRSEWFWCFWQCPDRVQSDVVDFMKKNYRPGFTYQDFASDFKFVVDHLDYVWTTVWIDYPISFRLEFFNASEWVNLFERSGARYAVLTSKHHEVPNIITSQVFTWKLNNYIINFNRVSQCGHQNTLSLGILWMWDQKGNFRTQNFSTFSIKGTQQRCGWRVLIGCAQIYIAPGLIPFPFWVV